MIRANERPVDSVATQKDRSPGQDAIGGIPRKSFSLLTYATHAAGSLQKMLDSEPSIQVGGWGQPWEKYIQKFTFVLNYAQQCPPEHVIIFVDGFDTELRLPVEVAVDRFRKMQVPFLVSSWGAESVFPELVARRAFACVTPECVNSGMYMGYASAMQLVLKSALDAGDARGDDQRALELSRARVRHLVHVDSACRIFLNLNARERAQGYYQDPVFLGRNGASWSRGAKALAMQSGHFSKLLSIDVGACLVAAGLGIAWGTFDMPTICARIPLFPFVVGLCCLFSPQLSVPVASVLFVLSLFSVCYGCTVPNSHPCG